MPNLFYPQLSIGAIAQYPLSKERKLRTIRNIMRDGSLISLPDPGVSVMNWNLQYAGLSKTDAAALKALFDACSGPFQQFTFVDPTGNALAWSSDLTNSIWQRPSLISIKGNASDPNGGSNAFTLVNNSQAFEEVIQTMPIPSNYQYCFSLSVFSPVSDSLVLLRRGSSAEDQTSISIPTGWVTIQSSGRLNDGGGVFTAGLRLAPGQSVTVYGPQLEAQVNRSPFQPTASLSAVFPNCFWATDEIAINADAPDSYSTLVRLETNV